MLIFLRQEKTLSFVKDAAQQVSIYIAYNSHDVSYKSIFINSHLYINVHASQITVTVTL